MQFENDLAASRIENDVHRLAQIALKVYSSLRWSARYRVTKLTGGTIRAGLGASPGRGQRQHSVFLRYSDASIHTKVRCPRQSCPEVLTA
jgi:hypothetical protein